MWAKTVNARNSEGMSAMMYAVRDRDAETIVALYKAGADVRAEDPDGVSAIMRGAAVNPDPKAVLALVEAGAGAGGFDSRGRSPLMWAAANNPNPDVVSALLESGANVYARDKDDASVLMHAAAHLVQVKLARLTTVVLVDRRHRAYPIRADIVGLTLSTTVQEHISVELGRKDAVYLS